MLFQEVLGLEGADAWVQTFHAFGARFLRREAARAGLPPSFAIYDDDDQKRLVKRILADMGISDDGRFGPRDVLSRIAATPVSQLLAPGPNARERSPAIARGAGVRCSSSAAPHRPAAGFPGSPTR